MAIQNTVLHESSYYCDVYLDVFDDLYGLVTRYRFETKELAVQFCHLKKCLVMTPDKK